MKDKRLPNARTLWLTFGTTLVFIYAAGAVIQLLAADQNTASPTGHVRMADPGPLQMSGGHTVRFVADWGFLLDPLSCVMVLVVTGVGFLIHVYSVGYMGHEGGTTASLVT